MSKQSPHPRMTITRHSITIAGPAGESPQTFARKLGPGPLGDGEPDGAAEHRAAGRRGAPAPEGEGAPTPSVPRHRRSA